MFRPLPVQRLETTLQVFEAELDVTDGDQQGSWRQRVEQLLDNARRSLNEWDSDKGWRLLKAADRLRLNGVQKEEVQSEAKAILAEVDNRSEVISQWRKDTIVSLLEDSDKLKQSLAAQPERLKSDISSQDVIRAKRTLDEHHDNVYHKQLIRNSRLRLLTFVGVLAVVVWIVLLPLSPEVRSLALTTSDNPAVTSSLSPRLLWLSVVLSGILGAVFSGFSSSMSSDQKKTGIPDELSASTLTYARLALSMVSALAVSIFLFTGVLSFPKPSLELLLLVAFVSGFSDRFLLRAIESIAK